MATLQWDAAPYYVYVIELSKDVLYEGALPKRIGAS
jgi:hypothetical protein